MNLLVDIGHPGHIHLFRNLLKEVKKKGHKYRIICRKTSVIISLLDHYELEYEITGKKNASILLKYLYQFIQTYKVYKVAINFKADLGIGVSMTLPIISRINKIQTIVFDDDDRKATPVFAFFAGLADSILTPKSLIQDYRGKRHLTYDGYHELAYLHPNRFTPDNKIFNLLGINKNTDYFIVRFNSFNAHHDVGQTGMSFEQKSELVRKLENHGKVFISAETKIDPAFSAYQLPDYPEHMHSFLAFAKMYVGESQTMTTEAAILGTPALKCNTFAGRLSIPNEIEDKYQLCFSYQPHNFKSMLVKIDELLLKPDLKNEWQKRRELMLADKIDVTAFLIWFVENYPTSIKTMKENPDYQNKFR